MNGYLKRNEEAEILENLTHFPAVAILGPRQCGKSTLAKHLLTPKPQRGFYQALDDLNIDEAWVIAPVEQSYPLKENIKVISLREVLGIRMK
ncbi:MAG: AAA family ATPase [bacterium]